MIEGIVRQLYSLVARPIASGLSWSMRRKGIWSDESIAQRYSRQLPDPSGVKPVWIHAASMGEVRVGAAVAHELEARGAVILGTAMTETGYNLMREIYPTGSVCTRAPFDMASPLTEFLNRYAPSALILVETEWWPNMLTYPQKHGIPAFVVNGRISDKAFPRYRWTSWFWRPVLSRVNRFYMRSQIDADRLLALGVDSTRVTVSGSLKVATAPAVSQSTRELVESLTRESAPIWIAGSTRPGEEEIILDAHRELLGEFPELQLWLTPRHPERFDTVVALLKREGLPFVRLSALDSAASPSVVLIDRMGILPELYGYAKVAFVGGSLRPFGGHNPLEPAICGTPVLFGPSMESQQESAQWLLNAGYARRVSDADSLAEAVSRNLHRPTSVTDREAMIAALKTHSTEVVANVVADIISRVTPNEAQARP